MLRLLHRYLPVTSHSPTPSLNPSFLKYQFLWAGFTQTRPFSIHRPRSTLGSRTGGDGGGGYKGKFKDYRGKLSRGEIRNPSSWLGRKEKRAGFDKGGDNVGSSRSRDNDKRGGFVLSNVERFSSANSRFGGKDKRGGVVSSNVERYSSENSRFGGKDKRGGVVSSSVERYSSANSRFGGKDKRGGVVSSSVERYSSEKSRFGDKDKGKERVFGARDRGNGGRRVSSGRKSDREGISFIEEKDVVRYKNGKPVSSSGGKSDRGRSTKTKDDVVEVKGFGFYEPKKKEEGKLGFKDSSLKREDEKIKSRSTSTKVDEEIGGRNEGVSPSSEPSSIAEEDDSYLTETRFDEYAISPLSLKALKDVGYEKMTVVQKATLPVILKGKDVVARARTGTGKTVAFLLPSIQVAIKALHAKNDKKQPPILVLVVCPTRELANQAASEASALVKYHSSIDVQAVMGGTKLAVEQKFMQASPCQILVATPGRLMDHLEKTAGFASRLMGVKVLVLDEADLLLDMGFRKDIEKIVSSVSKQRQTLLFSATIPDEVRKISHIALKRDHEFINTVGEGTGETHSQVRQMHLVTPLENHFSLLYAILKDHISNDESYKVVIFCTTALVTRLVANLLGELDLNVREIHSRIPQTYRSIVSEEFRNSKGLILVTSDISARGIDYPDVTLVIQVGLPTDREQYIHRLGRTGRKGREGEGILMLAPWEASFLDSIKDLPISKAEPPMVDPDVRKKVEQALCNVEMKNKEAAYQAWLGYYNSAKTVGRNKRRLVQLAKEFSRSMGLDNPPGISKLVLSEMGLSDIPGLRFK